MRINNCYARRIEHENQQFLCMKIIDDLMRIQYTRKTFKLNIVSRYKPNYNNKNTLSLGVNVLPKDQTELIIIIKNKHWINHHTELIILLDFHTTDTSSVIRQFSKRQNTLYEVEHAWIVLWSLSTLAKKPGQLKYTRNIPHRQISNLTSAIESLLDKQKIICFKLWHTIWLFAV